MSHARDEEQVADAKRCLQAARRLSQAFHERAAQRKGMDREAVLAHYRDVRTLRNGALMRPDAPHEFAPVLRVTYAYLDLYEHPTAARVAEFCKCLRVALRTVLRIKAGSRWSLLLPLLLGEQEAAQVGQELEDPAQLSYDCLKALQTVSAAWEIYAGFSDEQTLSDIVRTQPVSVCSSPIPISQGERDTRLAGLRQEEACWPDAASAGFSLSKLLDMDGTSEPSESGGVLSSQSYELPIAPTGLQWSPAFQLTQRLLGEILDAIGDRELTRRAIMRYLVHRPVGRLARLCFDLLGDEETAEDEIRTCCEGLIEWEGYLRITDRTQAVISYLDESLGGLDEIVSALQISKASLRRWKSGKVKRCEQMPQLETLAAFTYDAARVLGDDPELLMAYIRGGAGAVADAVPAEDGRRLWSGDADDEERTTPLMLAACRGSAQARIDNHGSLSVRPF